MPYDTSQLLTFAQGLTLDWAVKNPIYKWFVPEVVVMTEKFVYKNYGLGNVLSTVDTRRSMGGSPARIALSVSDTQGVLLENALETTIDDIERRQNPESMAQLEQFKIGDLTRTIMTNELKKVLAFIYSNVAVTPTFGVWSGSSTVDPIAEIDAIAQAQVDATGQAPNKLYMDLKSWVQMKNNKQVLGRIQYVKEATATTADIAGLLAMPMEIKIGGGALFGGGTNNNVVVFYSQDTSSVGDPSFAKMFVRTADRFTALRTYRQEEIRSDVYGLDWQELLVMTAASMATRIQTT